MAPILDRRAGYRAARHPLGSRLADIVQDYVQEGCGGFCGSVSLADGTGPTEGEAHVVTSHKPGP